MTKKTTTGPKKGRVAQPLEIPCLEFSQGNHKLYAFIMNASSAWKSFSIKRLTEDDTDDDFGYQRILSPARLSNISKYITAGNPIPNSIIVSLDKATYNRQKKTINIPKGFDVGWVI